MLGRFADRYVATMDDVQLDRYEALLEESDPDLLAWIAGARRCPRGTITNCSGCCGAFEPAGRCDEAAIGFGLSTGIEADWSKWLTWQSISLIRGIAAAPADGSSRPRSTGWTRCTSPSWRASAEPAGLLHVAATRRAPTGWPS